MPEIGEKRINAGPSFSGIMKATVLVILILTFGFIAAAGCTAASHSPAPATTTIVQSTTPAITTPQETRAHYVVGVDADFPPFTSIDSAGNFSGFDIEVARSIAAREGFDVSFVAVPWDSAISSLESKQIDLIWSGVTISPERSARVNFSTPYYRVNQSIAIREGSGFTLQDFNTGKLRIGAQTGSTEAEWVQVNLVGTGIMPASNLTLSPDIATLAGNLVNGTVDAVLIQEPTLADTIKGKPLIMIGKTGAQDSYAVAIRKNDTALQATLDHGLALLMNDPSWQALKAKYGLS